MEVERLAAHAVRSGTRRSPCCARPRWSGARSGPAYDGRQLRSLAGSRLLATRGHEPLWQLCHSDDLLTALELAVRERVDGGVVVACEGALTQSEVEALSGRRRLELPPAVALSTADRLHRYGVVPLSRRELERVLAPLVLDPASLRAAGWSAGVEQRRGAGGPPGRPRRRTGRGPGVGAAAGATVALVGTAALVRAARRKRRRR